MRITKGLVLAHLDYINSNVLTKRPLILKYGQNGDFIISIHTDNNDTLQLYRASTLREIEAFLTGFKKSNEQFQNRTKEV